jgi:pSer/pThr/pTyr-binding forkhead associated (FHA) protein
MPQRPRPTSEYGESAQEPRTQISQRVHGFRPRPTRAHVLLQTDGPGSLLRFELEKAVVTVGRSSSSDIVLENDNVSRSHALLTRIDDEYTVEDLDSRNGVLLNGMLVHAAVLRDGDEVHIGDYVFTYQEGT